MARNRRGRRRFSGLFLVIGCEAFVGGTRSEAVEVQKDTWNWAVSMLSVARHFDGAQGKVAPMGDSNTYANPAGRWVRIGVGKSRAEAALSRWMYSHREDEHNGWWLAADDQPEG